MMINKKILIVAGLILLVIIFVSYQINLGQVKKAPRETDVSNESPKIVSTKPEPLDEAVVAADAVIEISFNRPLQNSAELKLRIEPEMDYKVELSGDRKTAKIIPEKPYPLGTTFTLFIGPETKFDGVGRWGQEKVYHFRTIKYTGV